MTSPILTRCRHAADFVEHAADRLGSAWEGHAPLLDLCAQFRHACEQLASNRGLSAITIAFVGPKKAGKSTLLSLLIRSEEKRRRLKIGRTAEESTSRVTWFSAQPPAELDGGNEELIPCHDSELVSLGFRYSLVDVPGFNERDQVRSAAAVRALDTAVVKVLVVDSREVESREIVHYLGNADGATLVPVVNLVRNGETGAELADFHERLARELPRSHVLPPVLVPDYEIAPDRDHILAEAARELTARLSDAVAGRNAEVLAEPQLVEKRRQFQGRAAQLAAEHLPATATALAELRTALEKLPAHALEKLLGEDRIIEVNVRGRFRALLLERTPILFFPWRLALSIANIVHGATDRVPLVLLGSLPSLLTTAFAAAKNAKQASDFSEQMEAGLQRRIGAVLKESAGPQLQAVDYALQRDLGLSRGATPHTATTSTANLTGLETLQTRSAEIFHEVIGHFAPGRMAAAFVALLGFALFWGVFGWPVYALYEEYARAAQQMSLGVRTLVHEFPEGVFSVLATSVLLALMPMCVFLLCCIAWFARRGKVRACVRELRAAHSAELERLQRGGLLSVEVSEPRIDTCLQLLTFAERS